MCNISNHQSHQESRHLEGHQEIKRRQKLKIMRSKGGKAKVKNNVQQLFFFAF
jgi:hypothetical protein